jgi:hypothetical protein
VALNTDGAKPRGRCVGIQPVFYSILTSADDHLPVARSVMVDFSPLMPNETKQKRQVAKIGLLLICF